MPTIWWIRRDLRLADNAALMAACAGDAPAVPVFVVDPGFNRSPYVASRRWAFLLANLRALDEDLRVRGSRLIVRYGLPHVVLPALARELGNATVHVQADVSPLGTARENAVAAAGVKLVRHPGLLVREPDQVQKQSGGPFTVYTPFARAWRALPLPASIELLPAPDTLRPPPAILSEALPKRPAFDRADLFPVGEAEAQRRLAVFATEIIGQYASNRDRMDLEGTSALSPYLRLGVLSPRQAILAALEARELATDPAARKGADTWLSELIWREFYLQILAHFPAARSGNFRPEYDAVCWRNDPEEFKAWCAGRTGYPVVDAAMRQLTASGWMHNRARMIAASFLVKDLLIDWRWGERWFMQHLIDGDPAANNGGWQWTAGTGTDAAPYFRIFNPTLQGKKFDPIGAYIRRWLPELRSVSNAFIHEPWRMSLADQREAGCLLGEHYPLPVVDHQEARRRTLEAYAEARR